MTAIASSQNSEVEQKRNSSVLFWVMQLIAMIPIMVLKNIPFSDYSNHLARVAVLIRDKDSVLFPTAYHLNLHFRPYLGFDSVAWLLCHIVSLQAGG